MKTFLDSIKARAELAQATLATADKLTQLEGAVKDAKTYFDRFSMTNGSPQKSEAHAAWSTASQTASYFRQELAVAEYVLRECTPLLNAHADLATAHSAYAEARAIKSASLADVANLQKLITELNGEIADLSAKAKQALSAHGQTSIAARLTGQQAPPTPKQITTLTIDLESRKVTLESAETMLASAEARRDLATDSAKESRANWQYARRRVATIEYHDALATIAPQVSIYLAAIGDNQIEFTPEPEAIQAAHDLINAELEEVN